MSSIITAPHKVRSSRAWQGSRYEPFPVTITNADGSTIVVEAQAVKRKVKKPKNKVRRSKVKPERLTFTMAEHNSSISETLDDFNKRIFAELGSVHK